MSSPEPKKNGMIPRISPQGGAHLPQLAILTLLVTVGVVVGRTAMDQSPEVGLAGVSPSAMGREDQVHEPMPVPLDRDAIEVPDTPSFAPLDTLAALEEHWGAEWHQIKEQLFGDDLEAQLQSVVMPWEQTADMHLSGYRLDARHRDLFYRRLMKWPGREYDTPVLIHDAGYAELTAQSLANSTGTSSLRGMPDHVIQQLDLDLNDVNDDLDSRIHEFMNLLDRAIELEFNSGGLVKAPLRVRTTEPNPDVVFGHTVRGNGWQSRLEVTGERYPYLADLHRQITFLRSARNASLTNLVAAHLGDS